MVLLPYLTANLTHLFFEEEICLRLIEEYHSHTEELERTVHLARQRHHDVLAILFSNVICKLLSVCSY